MRAKLDVVLKTTGLLMLLLLWSCAENKSPDLLENKPINDNTTSVESVPQGKIRIRMLDKSGAILKQDLIDAHTASFKKQSGAASIPVPYSYITPKFDQNTGANEQLIIVANVPSTVYVGGTIYQPNAGNIIDVYPSSPGMLITSTQPVEATTFTRVAGYYRAFQLLPYSMCGTIYRMPGLGDFPNMSMSISAFENNTTVNLGTPWYLNANQSIWVQNGTVPTGTLIQSNHPIQVCVQVVYPNYCRSVTLVPLNADAD